MEKIAVARSICRAACFRSSLIAAAASNRHFCHLLSSRTLFSLSSSYASVPSKSIPFDCRSYLVKGLGCTRYFSKDTTDMPDIKDPEIQRAFKDLMAASWDDLPNSVIHGAKKALSKNTDDKVSQEVLKNVLCAAEAVEDFSGVITSIKMELDDIIGMSGEDVTKALPEELPKAICTALERYFTYLNSFGPDESYLQKKVETELGSKMIFLKMRCRGLGSEWGKISVLATSGLAGSYVEKRA